MHHECRDTTASWCRIICGYPRNLAKSNVNAALIARNLRRFVPFWRGNLARGRRGSGRRAPAPAIAGVIAEDRHLNRAGGVLNVLCERRARALGVARERRLDNLGVLGTQAPARDRTPEHGAVAVAL